MLFFVNNIKNICSCRILSIYLHYNYKKQDNMKKIFLSLVIILLCCSVSLSAQKVYFECNINTVNKLYGGKNLKENGGYVFIKNTAYKNTGSSGLFICHSYRTDEYYAYDTECPACKANCSHCTIYLADCGTVRCKKCPAAFQIVFEGSPSQMNMDGAYSLTDYKVYKVNDKLIITDQILEQYLF